MADPLAWLKDRDYGESCFYLRLSLSGETDPVREGSYRIAQHRHSQVCRTLPEKALVALELERDLLEVGDTSLAEATAFHLASICTSIPLICSFL